MRKKITPPYGLKAFTLSEVLITLVIIGVIAAITVPNIIQSSQNKEFHSALKKNMSVIRNALDLAQIDYGIMGDNSVVFTPSDSQDKHYETAKRFAKYLNTVKICNGRLDNNCSDIYYKIKYDVKEYANGYAYTNYPKIVLSDGSIYEIQQDDCGSYYDSCVTDEYGNCKKDDNGNVIPTVGYSDVCGYIKVDVNGAKAPNQFGWDIFWLKVYKDKIIINNWAPSGGSKGNDIMTGKI